MKLNFFKKAKTGWELTDLMYSLEKEDSKLLDYTKSYSLSAINHKRDRFVVITYFYSALSISEVFEDYIVSEKLKNVANKILYLFAIIMPIFTIFILYKLSL